MLNLHDLMYSSVMILLSSIALNQIDRNIYQWKTPAGPLIYLYLNSVIRELHKRMNRIGLDQTVWT